MKTLIAALAAVTTVTAVAAPAIATAAPRDHGRYEQSHGAYNLNQRQNELNRRIEVGQRRGVITGAEAGDLRTQSREIARLEARYRVNGLTARERADLDYRLDRLDARITRDTHDRDYGQGYGHRR